MYNELGLPVCSWDKEEDERAAVEEDNNSTPPLALTGSHSWMGEKKYALPADGIEVKLCVIPAMFSAPPEETKFFSHFFD